MQLRSLSQINFRNLSNARLEFASGITAIVGKNAAGKSNLLEAIYLACSGDLPSGKIVESLRLGESEGFVSAKVERQDGIATIEVGLAPGRKLLRLDGQTVRPGDIAKVSAAVLISPEDADLIHGSPSQRRAYLDTLLAKLSLRYAVLSREYNRVLEQRNAALKHPYEDATLAVWTEKFLDLGTEIESLRQRALKRIREIASASYRDIASDSKTLGLSLEHQQSLAERLMQSRHEERARSVTVVGPHRDDLLLTLGGNSVQAYGSRGEARTAALALRVAEYQLLEEKHGEAPVLLLDDFTAELDANRRAYLLDLAAKTPQAIVSGTETPPQYASLYHVSGGHFSAAHV